MLRGLPQEVFMERAAAFERALGKAADAARLSLSAPITKAILSALSERDASAAVCRDKDGNPEADADLRDTENDPRSENVDAYFTREVLPHVPDAWVNTALRDKIGSFHRLGHTLRLLRAAKLI